MYLNYFHKFFSNYFCNKQINKKEKELKQHPKMCLLPVDN